jgi:hypothetical protein
MLNNMLGIVEDFIDDLNANVIVFAALIFVNLKFDKFHEILFFQKLLNMLL